MKMQPSTSFIQLRRLIVLGSVVACAAISAVGASAGSTVVAPDVFERYVAIHNPNSATAADVVERYVTAHSLGVAAVVPPVGTDRIVDDWFRDPKPVVTPIATPAVDRIVDDSFRDTARYVPATSGGRSGLDWEDFGIGAGAMLGLTLLLAGLGFGAVTVRQRGGRLEAS
jgi:hypothetical protein